MALGPPGSGPVITGLAAEGRGWLIGDLGVAWAAPETATMAPAAKAVANAVANAARSDLDRLPSHVSTFLTIEAVLPPVIAAICRSSRTTVPSGCGPGDRNAFGTECQTLGAAPVSPVVQTIGGEAR